VQPGLVQPGLEQNVLPGELAVRIVLHVAALAHAIAAAEIVRLRNQRANLFGAPDVKGAFALLMWMRGIDGAIGILRRVESAAGVRHIAEHVVERAARDLRVLRIARDLERFHVGHGQLRLVVEHLFESAARTSARPTE